MTNMKDKLSASVRQAKAAQKPQPVKPAAKPSAATKPAAAAKPAAPKAPVARAAAPKPAAPKPAARPPVQPTVSSGGNALFPERVWPD